MVTLGGDEFAIACIMAISNFIASMNITWKRHLLSRQTDVLCNLFPEIIHSICDDATLTHGEHAHILTVLSHCHSDAQKLAIILAHQDKAGTHQTNGCISYR